MSATIKNLSENGAYSTHKVYSMATSEMKICELPILNKDHIYKNIRNIRKRNSIVVDSSKNLEELNIKTLRGQDFCLFDSGTDKPNRFVILTTSENLLHLENADH